MYTRSTQVINKTGIHARPASDFVKLANTFKSDIAIRNDDTEVDGNAKSIISILTMELVKGTTITLSADGEDETEAVDRLIETVDAGFGEL